MRVLQTGWHLDSRDPIMSKPRLSFMQHWPAIAAACLYGWVEWIALSRSRAIDALVQLRRR